MAHADSPSLRGPAGRVVGLDPGERWIGVAVSDDDRRLALPLATIDRRAESDEGVAAIRDRLGPEGASLVVVGVPLRPDGAEDAQARNFRALGEQMAAALGLPCEVVSERFSNPLPTSVPSAQLPGRGRPKARRKGKVSVEKHKQRRTEEHAVAAANILQRWLDALTRRES